MRPSYIVAALSALLPISIAAPIPDDDFSGLTDVNANVTGTASAELTKRCTWNDGIGDIDCGFLSVLFGQNECDPDRWTITIQAHDMDRAGGSLNCPSGGGYGGWTSFTSSLPYTVDIHGGNACTHAFDSDNCILLSGAWDDVWINYANQHLNIPTDARCGPIWVNGESRRCIIAIRP